MRFRKIGNHNFFQISWISTKTTCSFKNWDTFTFLEKFTYVDDWGHDDFWLSFTRVICEMWISWRVLLYCNAFRKSVLVFIYNHLTHLLAWRNSLQAKKRPQKRCYITSNPSTNLFTPWHPLRAALWARIAQNVKKTSRTVNVIEFECFDFNIPIWVPWSSIGPKKLWYIGRIIQIPKICGEKQGAFCSISKISLNSL